MDRSGFPDHAGCPLCAAGVGARSRHRAAIRARHSLSIFGLAEIPSPWIADRAFASNMKEVHEVLANLLVILALFHMTAALVHHWVFGDSTQRRTLPCLHKQA